MSKRPIFCLSKHRGYASFCASNNQNLMNELRQKYPSNSDEILSQKTSSGCLLTIAKRLVKYTSYTQKEMSFSFTRRCNSF